MRFIYLTLYTAPLSHVIAEHDVEHNLYADDTQISISLSGSEALESLPDLKSCVTDVFTWMTNSNQYFWMYVTYVVYRCHYGVGYIPVLLNVCDIRGLSLSLKGRIYTGTSECMWHTWFIIVTMGSDIYQYILMYVTYLVYRS